MVVGTQMEPHPATILHAHVAKVSNGKWVKNGSKTRCSKSAPGPFGMLKQVFLARFEPVLTEFSPFHHMYAPSCALRTYLRAVSWSHLELEEGCRLEDIYI